MGPNLQDQPRKASFTRECVPSTYLTVTEVLKEKARKVMIELGNHTNGHLRMLLDYDPRFINSSLIQRSTKYEDGSMKGKYTIQMSDK